MVVARPMGGFMNILVACKTDTIAPHIHVLSRDIPFILNITPSALRIITGQWFQMGAHGGRQVLVGVVAAGTVRDMDVEYRVTHGRV